MSAHSVSFAYSVVDAVRDVTLDVERASFVSLIGPNGSGKTTLLRLLSGVLSARAGTVEILGGDIRRMSRREVARRVAVVPQETSVVFPFTVEEVVLMGRFPHLGPYGLESKRDIEAAREAMEATDTTEFASRRIQELSGGERQRVIIARALAQGADILLLDEPTAFLDIKHQVDVATLVKRLQRELGLTIVMAGHDLNLAAAFSDSIVLMKSGRVFAAGAPADVIRPEILTSAYGTEVLVTQLNGRTLVAAAINPIDIKPGDTK